MTLQTKFTGFKRNTNRLNVTRHQKIGGGRTALTELGTKLGIEIFKMMDYVGKEVLLYFPLVLDADDNYLRDDNGERVKFYDQVITRQLQTLGGGNYAGVVRDTTGLGDLGLPGISGEPGFGEYLGKVSQYNQALAAVEAATKYQTTIDDKIISEEDRKAIWRAIFKKNPIGKQQAHYWFPVVVIEFEGSLDKGAVNYPLVDRVDENGEVILGKDGKPVKVPKAKLCWFKVAQAAYEKKFADQFKSISRSEELDDDGNVIVEAEDQDFSGYFARLNLTMTKDNKGVEIKDNNKLAMHLGKEYGVTILSKEQSKFKKLYKGFEPLFAEWDAKANELYNEAALAETVIDCALIKDEELKAKLDALYKNIDVETSSLESTAKAILAGGAAPTLGGADAVLSGGAGQQIAQPEVQQLGAGQEEDSAFSDDFSWTATNE